MAEPEDLIVEFAHRGVVAAGRFWLRHHADGDAAAHRLSGLRPHLELLLAGLVDQPMSLVPADAPAPASWVARLARPLPRHLRGLPPPPACDGAHIYLPRVLPPVLAAAGLPPPAAYRLLLVEQVARLRRGSSAALPAGNAPLAFLYELAEAAACDAWIEAALPGLRAELRLARRAMLTERPPLSRLSPVEAVLEGLLLEALEDPADSGVPAAASPEGSRGWAEATVASLPAADRQFRGLPPVVLWGRVLPPASAGTSVKSLAGAKRAGPDRPSPGRTSLLQRAPRPRAGDPDEEAGRMGTWIIRPDEPQESVEDPFGMQRPADRDGDLAPEELADALADLPETRVVTTPEPAREVLATEGPSPRGPRAPASPAGGAGIIYPEWDYRAQAYRLRGAVVHESAVPSGSGAWADAALGRQRALVRQVRRQFAQLRPRRVRLRRQPEGEDIDLDAWVETWADRRAGMAAAATEDRHYLAARPARRSLAIAILIDVSASTDSWIGGQRRVIDVEKEALLVVGEALERLGDRHAVFAFSGEGSGAVRVQVVKGFDERGGRQVASRIERLEPDRYTRVGAALRHVTGRLALEPAQRRLLLLLTDGRPNDVDEYEGRYGVEDTARAVREAAAEGITVFALTVDHTAPAYLGEIFGPGCAALLRRPELLPPALVEVLRRLLESA